MKKMTNTQRQWALTLALTTALGANMVSSLGQGGYSMANYSSSEPRYESLISNQGEELKVQYLATEDGKTTAIVPQKTESGLCYECGEKYLLPKNFDSSATALEAALRKAMYEERKSAAAPASAPAAKPVAEKKQEQEEVEVEQENADFLALRERCDKKSDDSFRLSCYANGLTKLLKDKKKSFDRDEVMDLFRSEIEPGLRQGLADVSDLVPRRASRLDSGEFSDMGDSRREETQALVEDMLAQIGSKYNYLRQRLTMIAAKAVLSSQESAQAKLKQADQLKTSNPETALRLQTEGYAKLRAANQIANDIGGSLYDGLESALWSRLINDDQFDSMYQTNYASVVNQAIQGLTANPLTYVIPSVTLADGTTIIDQSGQSFTVTPSPNQATNPAVQNRNGGRGITVIMNNLTPANVVTAQSPRIAIATGAPVPQGTATIQLYQGTPAPVSTESPATVRLRGR